VKLSYKKKGQKALVIIDDLKGFKTGYAHLHYWANDSFEHCIPYSEVESFKFEGDIPEEIKDRKQKSVKSMEPVS
jgi:hypothetical protein